MSWLDLSPVHALRRNHAVEHATMHILVRRHPYLNAVARTDLDGFNVYGQVDTKTLADTAAEALGRLQNGESDLAVHPRCGTNLAVSGLLAGVGTFVAMGRSKPRLSKLPSFILAATIAVLVAQPLGLIVQKHITTSPHVEGLAIKQVTRREIAGLTVHKVELEQAC